MSSFRRSIDFMQRGQTGDIKCPQPGKEPRFLGPPIQDGLGCGCEEKEQPEVNVETIATFDIPKELIWGAVIFGVLFLLKK